LGIALAGGLPVVGASWCRRSWGFGWLIWLRLVLDLRGIMVLIGIGIVRIGVVSVTPGFLTVQLACHSSSKM